jgi:hypothetical protein
MKRQMMFGTMLSAALAVGVSAQQPPAGGSPGASPQPPSDRPAAQSMTVTGCLQAASDSAGGAPAAAAEPGAKAAGGFVLTNVSPAGSMAGGSTAPGAKAPGATTGTTGAGATGTSGTSAASRYRLTGGESQNLQQYVGQKVEVTGSAAGGASSASPSATPGAPGAPGASASGSSRSQDQAFRVASVRPTGDKCNE